MLGPFKDSRFVNGTRDALSRLRHDMVKPRRAANGQLDASGRRIALLVSASAAMTLACLFAVIGQRALMNAYAVRADALNSQAQAQMHFDRERQGANTAQAARMLLRTGERSGLGVNNWAIRRIDIRKAAMTRDAFNELLSEITRSRTQVFGADEFEISVKNANSSLFETPAASEPDQTLSVTLTGALYFRLGDAS